MQTGRPPEHGLFAHEAVEQQGGVGQERRHGIQPSEREQCVVEPAPHAGDQTSGGLGGRGAGTNARKRSDAVDTFRY